MSIGVTTEKPFSRVTGKSGTMTRNQVRNYVYQLKMFLAKQGVSFEEKARIEAEINAWGNIKQISIKIVGK